MPPMRVTIEEDSPRDGFQIEPRVIPTAHKIAFIDRLSETGLGEIQVTSFVHPRLVPQMADAEQVMAGIRRNPKVRYMAVAPNLRGAERALATGIDKLGVFMSATESHNLANVRMTREESLRQFEPMVRLARDRGVAVRGSLSCTFGCRFEGRVALSEILRLSRRLWDLGITEIGLSDTTGMGNPLLVGEVVAAVQAALPEALLSIHLHNTTNTGLANAYAAWQAGAHHFSASVGGMGGCPFAPGATGNVPTEDLVHMFHEMGVETGVDLEKLIECARFAEQIVGHELPGQVMKAGPNSRLVDLNTYLAGKAAAAGQATAAGRAAP